MGSSSLWWGREGEESLTEIKQEHWPRVLLRAAGTGLKKLSPASEVPFERNVTAVVVELWCPALATEKSRKDGARSYAARMI
jgi:hypothetical protein